MFKIFIAAILLNGQVVGFGFSHKDYETKETCIGAMRDAMEQVREYHKSVGQEVTPQGGCLPSDEAVALYKKMEQANEAKHSGDSI